MLFVDFSLCICIDAGFLDKDSSSFKTNRQIHLTLPLPLFRMQKLIKPSVDRRYVDLTVSFAPEADGDDDLPGPPVRYFLSRNGETP